MSRPSGASEHARVGQQPTISVTADSKSPASGATAPRKPSMPGAPVRRARATGEYSLWCRAAEPKSHTIGSPSAGQQA